MRLGWGDADLACANIYFEKVYKIWSPDKFKDALLGVVASERYYHPIKEYFSTLTWDKTPRIDTLLVDYLGANDNEFVRAVTGKTLCAAVVLRFPFNLRHERQDSSGKIAGVLDIIAGRVGRNEKNRCGND